MTTTVVDYFLDPNIEAIDFKDEFLNVGDEIDFIFQTI